MPTLKSSPKLPTKKRLAKKLSTAAPSKRSATSATKKPKPQATQVRPQTPAAKIKSPPSAVPLKVLPPRSTSRAEILKRLNEHYPDAHCELNHKNPFELLVATVLSAQCTDAMVNKATPGLFAVYPTAEALAQAPLEHVETLIKSIGLYRNKAKNILSLAKDLVQKHEGQVPQDLKSLTELAGVGRKTANVVLGNAFGIASGIVVDTHVARLSQRFGWTISEKPEQIEKELIAFVPASHWVQISHELIFHGRRVCKARGPACDSCFLNEISPRIGLTDPRD